MTEDIRQRLAFHFFVFCPQSFVLFYLSQNWNETTSKRFASLRPQNDPPLPWNPNVTAQRPVGNGRSSAMPSVRSVFPSPDGTATRPYEAPFPSRSSMIPPVRGTTRNVSFAAVRGMSK